MSQLKITNGGIEYKNHVFAGLESLNITHMVFAYVPGLKPTDAISANATVPTNHVVHTQPIHRVSGLEQNAVVISAILDYQVGDFKFNWFGALATKANGQQVLLAVVHTANQTKTKTHGATIGDYTVKSIIWKSNNIVDSLNVQLNTLPWQVDDAVFATQADKHALQHHINTLDNKLAHTPQQQKVPQANNNGEIAEGWLNIERTLTRIATSLALLQMEKLTKKTEVAELQKQLSELKTNLTKKGVYTLPSSIALAKIEQQLNTHTKQLSNITNAHHSQSTELTTAMRIVQNLMVDIEHVNTLFVQTQTNAHHASKAKAELVHAASAIKSDARRVNVQTQITNNAKHQVAQHTEQVTKHVLQTELKSSLAGVQAAASSVLAITTEQQQNQAAEHANNATLASTQATQAKQQAELAQQHSDQQRLRTEFQTAASAVLAITTEQQKQQAESAKTAAEQATTQTKSHRLITEFQAAASSVLAITTEQHTHQAEQATHRAELAKTEAERQRLNVELQAAATAVLALVTEQHKHTVEALINQLTEQQNTLAQNVKTLFQHQLSGTLTHVEIDKLLQGNNL